MFRASILLTNPCRLYQRLCCESARKGYASLMGQRNLKIVCSDTLVALLQRREHRKTIPPNTNKVVFEASQP